jgi:hypothetical protein
VCLSIIKVRRQLIHSVSFVDRDMMMRYHWGLAVGHLYAYRKLVILPDAEDSNSHENQKEWSGDEGDVPLWDTPNAAVEGSGSPPPSDCESNNSDTDDLDETWELDSEGEDTDGDEMEDEELLAMEDMYGF